MRAASLLIAVASLACAGCSARPGAMRVMLEREFRLAPDGRASIFETGQVVRFDSVTADSRCPSDVTCVHAGNAGAVLNIRTGGRDTTIVLNTNIEPRDAVVGPTRFHLVRLMPIPLSTAAVAPRDYRAILVASDLR